MSAPKSPYRLGMAGAAIVALLAMPTAAVAVDDETAVQIEHYLDCLTWLLTDPAKHELYCTPARPFDIPVNSSEVIILSIGPFTSPSAWSDCEEGCQPASSQPTSEPSQPTSESSQSTSEPSQSTSEPSQSTSEPSQPTPESTSESSTPSESTSEPSQPEESQPPSESQPTEEPPPPSESEFCEGTFCFPP